MASPECSSLQYGAPKSPLRFARLRRKPIGRDLLDRRLGGAKRIGNGALTAVRLLLYIVFGLSLLDFTAAAPYVVLHKTIRAPLAGTPTTVSANPAMSDHRVSCQRVVALRFDSRAFASCDEIGPTAPRRTRRIERDEEQ